MCVHVHACMLYLCVCVCPLMNLMKQSSERLCILRECVNHFSGCRPSPDTTCLSLSYLLAYRDQGVGISTIWVWDGRGVSTPTYWNKHFLLLNPNVALRLKLGKIYQVA